MNNFPPVTEIASLKWNNTPFIVICNGTNDGERKTTSKIWVTNVTGRAPLPGRPVMTVKPEQWELL